MANRGRRPRPLEPHRLGRSDLHQQRAQRQGQSGAEGRPLRRHHAGRRRHAASVDGDVLRQAQRQAAVAAHGAHGCAEGETALQVHAGELHARHRRQVHRRVLRIGRPLRLRHERHGGVEERLRRPRLRLLHGARGAVGLCQLAGDPRQPRGDSGGRAEGIVCRRPAPADRTRIVAHAAQRSAHVQHAHGGDRWRAPTGRRQRLEAHRRLRSRDRQGTVAHDRRRRHSGADARSPATA